MEPLISEINKILHSACPGPHLQDAGVVVVENLDDVGRLHHLLVLGPGKVGFGLGLNFTGEVHFARQEAVGHGLVIIVPKWLVCNQQDRDQYVAMKTVFVILRNKVHQIQL